MGAELQYLTRRAFIPKLVVQIYQASPTISALIANAHMASGGVSGVTCPVQGTPYVTTSASDYTGTFSQPAVQTGSLNAEFNLKLCVTPIPFLGMEGAVQINAAVIPIIEARMNDAGNSIVDYLSTQLWTNSTDGLNMMGLPGAISNVDPTNNAFGGIARSSNTWWQSKVYDAVNQQPTRNLMLQYIAGTVKYSGGEMPSFGVMGIGTWYQLATDYTSVERYNITPENSFDQASNGARSLFTALMVAGVPFYMDPYATEGVLYLINMNYLSLYIHEDAAFAFTGFESTLPNYQIGYIGALLAILELVLVKPKSCVQVKNLAFTSL